MRKLAIIVASVLAIACAAGPYRISREVIIEGTLGTGWGELAVGRSIHLGVGADWRCERPLQTQVTDSTGRFSFRLAREAHEAAQASLRLCLVPTVDGTGSAFPMQQLTIREGVRRIRLRCAEHGDQGMPSCEAA